MRTSTSSGTLSICNKHKGVCDLCSVFKMQQTNGGVCVFSCAVACLRKRVCVFCLVLVRAYEHQHQQIIKNHNINSIVVVKIIIITSITMGRSAR
jgi:hypothetical protein